ncbi:MAG TPA: O-acetylhomoserine aminocarboxypropyltransferase/cysteine synthase [Candidatus Lokiarchaeia archaeon]|nr:O-acetylhomoserine aminocarboxypropyltransferase/cysteine synthase [Candidatus Lokiarchaeia archaeon]
MSPDNQKRYRFDTLALHGGQVVDKDNFARAPPIYQTTSYLFKDTDHAANLFALKEAGNIYTRLMNPTTGTFENRVALLEGGVGALALASGQAAETIALLTIVSHGQEILSSTHLYGGTYNLLRTTFSRFGIKVNFVDQDNLDNFSQGITPQTQAIYAETLGNPFLHTLDIEELAKIAHEASIPLIVDNTIPSPYLCNPIKWGADIIVHSATKFIGGHGTSIGGIIVDSGNFDWSSGKYPELSSPDDTYNGLVFTEAFGNAAFIAKARVCQLRDLGPTLSPFNSFLFLQGLETLHLRLPRHCSNAQAVAEFLLEHPKVAWVNYPGLPDHPTYHFAQKYFENKGFGAILGFGIKGGLEAGKKFVNSVQLFSHLANIGDAKSLCIHPASTTHQQLTREEQEKTGVTEDYVRLSIGLEDPNDIIEDLDQALAQV